MIKFINKIKELKGRCAFNKLFVISVCVTNLFISEQLIAQAQDPIIYTGQKIIKEKGIYTGNWESTNSNAPAVIIQTDDTVTIINSNIRSAGHCIYTNGFKARIKIINTSGYGLTPTVNNIPHGRFLYAEDVSNVVVENNYLENTSGIKIVNYTGNKTPSQTIKVRFNRAKNINGKNRLGGDGSEKVQFCQLDKVQGVPGIEIAWNQILNEPGNSMVEDNINIYLSSGIIGSRIAIHDNFIDGAYPNNLTSPNYAGGGIMVADATFDSINGITSSYSEAFNNQVIRTTNHGISIAGGSNNIIRNNRAVSSNLLPSGSKIIGLGDVGMYITNLKDQPSSLYHSNSANDNVSGWVDRERGIRNDFSFPGCMDCTNSQNIPRSGDINSITRALEDAEYPIWYQKVQSNSVKIGIPPSVSITSPSNNSTFAAGSSITISADASDRDGNVTKVEFYKNNVLLGTDATSPFTFNLTISQAGTYAIIAKAYDNYFAYKSDTIDINVTPIIKVEAENYSLAVEDSPGSGTNISKQSVSYHSGGQSVLLADIGDRIIISFAAPAGNYIIKAKVRSGTYATDAAGNVTYDNNQSFWTPINGYVFKVNGNVSSFSGDVNTIGIKDPSFGKSYWGIMNSISLSLVDGQNTIEIKANKAYAGADYIEISPSSSSSRIASIENENISKTSHFPNPVKDKLTINVNETRGELCTISIVDAFGNLKYENVHEVNSKKQIEVELSRKNIKPGVYYLRLSSGKVTEEVIKMIKE